jgi:erythritol transport system ATP-binding protein
VTEPEFIIEARNVSRQYPGTLALDCVSFALRPGTVTALIGENGAGKSTLVRILAGIERPTSGSLVLDGETMTLNSVRDADVRGIGIIHQELNLCPNLGVAENIFLAREITVRGVVDKRRQLQQARELLARLEHPIDPSALAGDLPLGQQQIVEIAKALSRNVRVLMMDEPTSALSASEIAILFRIIGDLKSRGVAIVYISHRLEELLEIADSVSVLRDGRMLAEAAACDVDTNWIVEKMTGRPAGQAQAPETRDTGNQILRLDSLSLNAAGGRPLLRGVSFDLRAGEVVGIYGLMGAGRTELLECIMGLHPEAAGSVYLESRPLDGIDTPGRIAAGLAMVPEDRQASGIIQSMTVRANMTLSSLGRYVRTAWLSLAAEDRAASAMSAELRIKSPGLRYSIASLSGGNQQKVVMAKCLLTNPRVLLLDEPTRGVDVGAKREIHAIVRRLAASGMGVILASSELDEIRATAGRIVVMSRGAVTAILPAAEATAEALVAAASPSAGERRDAA